MNARRLHKAAGVFFVERALGSRKTLDYLLEDLA
jgi:hypothetical protein